MMQIPAIKQLCKQCANRTSTAVHGLFLLAILVLAACSSQPTGQQGQGATTSDSPDAKAPSFPYDDTPLHQLLDQAQPYVANQLAIPAKLAIRIVEASNREQNWQSLNAVLRHTDTSQMDYALYGEYSLQLLSAWQQTGEHDKADRWLNSQLFLNHLPLMDVDQQILLSIERANNHYAMGRYLQSARERVFIEDFIEEEKIQRENAQYIWKALRAVPPLQLESAKSKSSNTSLTAWLELALSQQQTNELNTDHPSTESDWKSRWPEHKANKLLKAELTASKNFSNERPDAIGVFLPLSGAMRNIGEAVRDGILAGYFPGAASEYSGIPRYRSGRHSNFQPETPKIFFYDTNQSDMEQLYQRAIDDNVEFIIGPLQKNKVKALFTMPTSLPILTLNYVPDDLPPPTNIIQFGLAAEDEASRLATTVAGLGYSNPLLLTVDRSWANRAAEQFKLQWESLGKERLRQQTLSISSNFSGEVAETLGLSASESRRRALENATRMKFEFVPRRRQDHDAIVLFANSDESKNLKPLLAYHYAAELPVFASSYSYDIGTAKNSSNGNTDLNGIIFSEMPWFLQGSQSVVDTSSTLLSNTKDSQRLFAMGMDAYNLHYRINQLASFPAASWWANTGSLSIRDQRVVRDLPIAKLVAGKPQLLAEQEPASAEPENIDPANGEIEAIN